MTTPTSLGQNAYDKNVDVALPEKFIVDALPLRFYYCANG